MVINVSMFQDQAPVHRAGHVHPELQRRDRAGPRPVFAQRRQRHRCG